MIKKSNMEYAPRAQMTKRLLEECIGHVGIQNTIRILSLICYERGNHKTADKLHPSVLTHEQAHTLEELADALDNIADEL